MTGAGTDGAGFGKPKLKPPEAGGAAATLGASFTGTGAALALLAGTVAAVALAAVAGGAVVVGGAGFEAEEVDRKLKNPPLL